MKKYCPIYIAVGTLILINVIFLWNEPFNYSLTFDATKFSTMVYIVGIVLNSLTIFLLYKQIEEMALARKEANQPDLHASSLTFITEDRDSSQSTEKDKKDKPVFKKMDNGIFREVKTTSLHNIGLSSAKSIKLKWIYNTEEVEKYLHNIYDSAPYKNLPKNYIYDFIQSNNKSDIVLPYHYLMIYGEKCNSEENANSNKIKPKLELSLEYYDIYGNPYFKTINVNVSNIENQIHLNFTL